MIQTLIQMTLLIACGAAWRYFEPAHLEISIVRKVLTSLVYYLLLPAMIIEVMWQANMGWQSLKVIAVGSLSIIVGMGVMALVLSRLNITRAQKGALILVTAFPNVTYLGLPVLEQVLGDWARSVAIQMDLFSGQPLLYTVGIMIAHYYGRADNGVEKINGAVFNTPPFWAAGVALILNTAQISPPEFIHGTLERLSDGVIPLMLIALGMALDWQSFRRRAMSLLWPVVGVKLALMPLVALGLAGWLVVAPEVKVATVLEVAMPSGVLCLVLCDRYGLDAPLYAMAVTVTTVLSLLTLPLWYGVLS
jgi:hypothetical protein